MARKLPDIKQFRSQISKLKKQGVIPASVDARKVKPTRSLLNKIKKHELLLTGQEQAVKVGVKQAREYKDAGYRLVGKDRVIIAKAKNERVVNTSGGRIVLKNEYGDTKVRSPKLRLYTAADLERELRKLAPRKLPNQYFSFIYYGNPSHRYRFHDIESLIEEFLKYQSVDKAVDSHIPAELADVITNIEIITLNRGQSFGPRYQKPARPKKPRSITVKKTAGVSEKQRRAELKKKGGAAYEEQKRKARERARKSSEKRRKKK